jgi:hypothetical protein
MGAGAGRCRVDDVRSRIDDPLMVELYDYWAGKCRDGRVPARRDVDPVDLPRHLPNLMLIDVMGPPLRFRYRLVGTQVVAASAEDRTGVFFDAVEFFRKNPIVMTQYQEVVETRRAGLSLEPFRNFVDGTTYEVERLILPLASDGRTVDMLIVYFSFKTGPWARR